MQRELHTFYLNLTKKKDDSVHLCKTEPTKLQYTALDRNNIHVV